MHPYRPIFTSWLITKRIISILSHSLKFCISPSFSFTVVFNLLWYAIAVVNLLYKYIWH